MALNVEMSNREAENIQIKEEVNKFNVFKKQKTPNSNRKFNNSHKKKGVSNNMKNMCKKCGIKDHPEDTCPARKWKCFSCGKQGHASYVCRSKGQSLNGINAVSGYTTAYIAQIKVEGVLLKMEVDSGACNSVISLDKYHKSFKHLSIKKFDNNCTTVTGEPVRVLGKIEVLVCFQGQRHQLELLVIDARKDFYPLMGRTWLNVLSPGWRNDLLKKFGKQKPKINPLGKTESKVLNVLCDKFLKDLIIMYPNISPNSEKESPMNKFKVEIITEINAKPIFHGAYSVPFKIKDLVEVELLRLVNKGILEPVKHSNWASPIVVVTKPNNTIRLCVDFKKTINTVTKSEHYPILRIDEIFAGLANCSYFCVIDLSGAYQQLIVSESSRELLTINTHKALFRYTRLPFGLKTAPSIFQAVMDQILVNLASVKCYLDDILIGGSSKLDCEKKPSQSIRKVKRK